MTAKVVDGFLIAEYFKTDIKDIDLNILLQPKLWGQLNETPSYSAINSEIVVWLEMNTPLIYSIIKENSKRKSYDTILINLIKTKILVEQLNLNGLTSLDHGRFEKNSLAINKVLSSHLKKAQKNHDVKDNLVKYVTLYDNLNIAATRLYNVYGYHSIDTVNELLVKQPDSKYLILANSLIKESSVILKLIANIEILTSSPT